MAGRRPKRRERQVQEAAAALRAAGSEVQLARTTQAGSASTLAEAAVKEGSDLILVCGGDGTLNEVVNGVVPASVPVGILPGGTANIMARELGLPIHPVRAAAAVADWEPRRIAVGQVSWPEGSGARRCFLSVAGIGFDAYVVNKLALDFKLALGVVAYGIEAFRQGFRYSYPPFSCQVNGRQLRVPFAIVQRTSRYAGWLQLAPGASIFEPQFRICLFKGRGWLRYLIYATAAVTRTHLGLKDVELIESRSIHCLAADSGKPVYVELDGELAGQLPATFNVIPDALTLLVPKRNQSQE